MTESVKQPLDYIFNTFRQNNKVDLKSIKNYFDANKNLREDCKIFIRKLEIYLSSKSPIIISRQEFLEYFDQSVSNSTHFNAVFDSIDNDNSGFISKNELKELFRKANISFTEEDINMMIEGGTQDGQKIKKQVLERILKK